MTRNLTIGDTTCNECGQWYETIDEAAECEYLDILDEGEAARQEERDQQVADDAYLTSLHSFQFSAA